MKYFVVTIAGAIAAGTMGGGCLRVAVEPVEVKPITLNVNLKVDRELDDFFAFEKELGPATATRAPTAPSVPATLPATQGAIQAR